MSSNVEQGGANLFHDGAVSVALPVFLILLGLGLALLLAVHPLAAVGLTIAGLLAIQAARRPVVGLVTILSVVVLLGSDSIFKVQAGIQWVEVDLLLMIVVLGWSARSLFRGSGPILSRLDLTVILFAVAVIVGTHRGLSDGIPLSDLRSELRPPAYLILVYAISRTTFQDPKRVRLVFRILLIATVIAAVKALVIYAVVPLSAPGGEEQRIWATRVMNSDGFKRVIIQGGETFPVLMGLYAFPTLVASRSAKRRLLGWAVVSLFLLTVTVSMTRSYWIGFLAGVLSLLLIHRPRVNLRVAAELLGVIVVLAGLLGLLQNAVTGLSLAGIAEQLHVRLADSSAEGWDPSAAARLAELGAIREVLAEKPWTGTGFGGTYVFYSSLGGGLKEWEYTHNSYAYWAMKLGIPGLVTVLALLGLGLASAVRWIRLASSERERSLASGLLAGIVALCAISLTAPWLTHYVGAAWTGLVFGCSEGMRLKHEQAVSEGRE